MKWHTTSKVQVSSDHYIGKPAIKIISTKLDIFWYNSNSYLFCSIFIPMSSSQKAKAEEIIDTTEDSEQLEDGSNSEPDDDDHIENGPSPAEPSTSSKKKKKKQSKAMKALNALRGKQEIPQAVVDQVLDKVKAEGGSAAAGADEASVRAALEQMKIMDVAQGKAGIGGKNKKDMGQHKVCHPEPGAV